MEEVINTFDVETFIEEIRNRPAIWDLSSEDYNNNIRKQQSWNEIFSIAYKDYEEMPREKKIAVAKELSNKWKNFRQCFRRELEKRKSMKSGPGRSDQKGYVYFDGLSFPTPVVSSKSTASSLENEQEDEDLDASQSENVMSENVHIMKTSGSKKRNIREVDHMGELFDVLKESLTQRRNLETDVLDDDKHFLLSLLPSMKSVPKEMKLQMRADVLQLVARYCNASSGSPKPPFPSLQPLNYPPSYPSSYPHRSNNSGPHSKYQQYPQQSISFPQQYPQQSISFPQQYPQKSIPYPQQYPRFTQLPSSSNTLPTLKSNHFKNPATPSVIPYNSALSDSCPMSNTDRYSTSTMIDLEIN